MLLTKNVLFFSIRIVLRRRERQRRTASIINLSLLWKDGIHRDNIARTRLRWSSRCNHSSCKQKNIHFHLFITYLYKVCFLDGNLMNNYLLQCCPLCAWLPGPDPNLTIDDLAGHLTLEHRSGPRDLISFLDESASSRSVRRIPHPTRGVGGQRPRRYFHPLQKNLFKNAFKLLKYLIITIKIHNKNKICKRNFVIKNNY